MTGDICMNWEEILDKLNNNFQGIDNFQEERKGIKKSLKRFLSISPEELANAFNILNQIRKDLE